MVRADNAEHALVEVEVAIMAVVEAEVLEVDARAALHKFLQGQGVLVEGP